MGYNCDRKRTTSLMKVADVKVTKKYKSKKIIYKTENVKYANNFLNQKFNVSKPNQVWVSDITQIKTLTGWTYLAVVIDLYSRIVISCSLDKRNTADLVARAITKGINRRILNKNMLFHSDRGSQYCSNKVSEILEKNGIKSSMSLNGNCLDNAVAESFFATLKKEKIIGTIYKKHEEVVQDIIDYVEMFYNFVLVQT